MIQGFYNWLIVDLTPPVTLGAMADKPSLLESEGFILVGFFLVLAVLFLLYLLCLLIGLAFTRHERKLKALAAIVNAAAAPPAAAAPATSQEDTETDLRIAAVIAAAVHVTLGSSARVLKINLATSDEWAREGRRRHFASHKLR